MTNRHAGYLVVLESDVREDDAEKIINAIKMIKYVGSVQPITSDVTLQMAKESARIDLVNKIIQILK